MADSSTFGHESPLHGRSCRDDSILHREPSCRFIQHSASVRYRFGETILARVSYPHERFIRIEGIKKQPDAHCRRDGVHERSRGAE